jgi:hypothetical protein
MHLFGCPGYAALLGSKRIPAKHNYHKTAHHQYSGKRTQTQNIENSNTVFTLRRIVVITVK